MKKELASALRHIISDIFKHALHSVLVLLLRKGVKNSQADTAEHLRATFF